MYRGEVSWSQGYEQARDEKKTLVSIEEVSTLGKNQREILV